MSFVKEKNKKLVYTILSSCGMYYITTDDVEAELAWRHNRLVSVKVVRKLNKVLYVLKTYQPIVWWMMGKT